MKKVISLIIAVAMITCMFSVFASADDLKEIKFSFDAISGLKTKVLNATEDCLDVTAELKPGESLTLLGWVVSSKGHLSKLQYKIDNGSYKDCSNSYRDRPDVIGVFPGYDATNAGFGTDGAHMEAADVKTLAEGDYTVTIKAIISDGSEFEIAVIALSIDSGIVIPDATNFVLDANATAYQYGNGTAGDPFNFHGSNSVAVKFAIPTGKAATQLVFDDGPSWGNAAGTGSDALFTIYKWNTDYETTIAGKPVDSVQIYGHKDCLDVIIQFSKNISAGEYLLVGVANGANSIGCWSRGEQGAEEQFYVNGEAKDYQPSFFAMLVDDVTPPQTGDMTIAMFAVIAVVALAAVVVLKKRVNG